MKRNYFSYNSNLKYIFWKIKIEIIIDIELHY